MRFRDRQDAGEQLAARLTTSQWAAPVVLGLVRGGVEVALPVARALDAPLDVAIARKIGAPFQPEFGLGAVTPEGPATYDTATLRQLGLSESDLESVCERERLEGRRRRDLYRQAVAGVELPGRDVIVIDDGIATGSSARAALRAVRELGPSQLVLAAPVCARESVDSLTDEADQIICLQQPADLMAIGFWYDDFGQLSDDDVITFLRQAREVPSG